MLLKNSAHTVDANLQKHTWRQEGVPFPDTRTHSDPRTALRSRGSRRLRSLGGRQRHRDGLPSAHRGRAQDPVPHGRHHPGQDRRRKRRGPIGDVLPAAGGGQGQRHARDARLRDELGMDTYFADPYSSWQRGSNENRNGMIRYLPKRAVIDPGMAREVQEIVDEINNRPMRVLGYRTPAEAFTDELLNLKTQQGCCTYK